MAEERLIQFGIISASNLKDVNYISKMETYAVLTFAPYVEYTTQVDSKGGSNPRWDEKLGFLVPEELISRGDARIKVEIFTLSTLGPKFVSEVDIPLADLTVSTQFKEPVLKRYPLKTNSGDYHGDLHVSFALGEKVVLKKGEHPQYPIVTRFSPQASSPPHTHTPSTGLSSYSTPTSRPSQQVRFNGGPSSTATSYGNGLHSSVVPHRRPPTPPPPSVFESPPSSPFGPLSSRPKPTPPFEPSLPHVVHDGDDTFPPSYVSPFSTKPLKHPPQPTTTFTKPSPYGPPYVEGDSTTYHPIKPPRASPKFGSHGYNEPTSRIDVPITPFDRSGYGHGDDYGMKGPKFGASRVNMPIAGMHEETARFPPSEQSGYGGGATKYDDYGMKGPKFGTSRVNMPIASMNEETTRFPPFEQGGYGGGAAKYGYQSPTTDFNEVFGGPIGKLLLTELSKTTAYDRRY